MKSFSSAVLLMFVGCTTFLSAPFARLREAGEKSELRESLESIVLDDRWNRLDRLGPTVKPIVEAFKALVGRSKPGSVINLRCAPYTLGLLAGVNLEVHSRDLATEIDAAIDMYNTLLPDLHATKAFAYVAGYVDGFGCKTLLNKDGCYKIYLLREWSSRVDKIEGNFNGSQDNGRADVLWQLSERDGSATLFPENVAKSGRLNYLQLQRERKWLKRDYFGLKESSVVARAGAGAGIPVDVVLRSAVGIKTDSVLSGRRSEVSSAGDVYDGAAGTGLRITIRGAAAGAGSSGVIVQYGKKAAAAAALDPDYDRAIFTVVARGAGKKEAAASRPPEAVAAHSGGKGAPSQKRVPAHGGSPAASRS